MFITVGAIYCNAHVGRSFIIYLMYEISCVIWSIIRTDMNVIHYVIIMHCTFADIGLKFLYGCACLLQVIVIIYSLIEAKV